MVKEYEEKSMVLASSMDNICRSSGHRPEIEACESHACIPCSVPPLAP